MQIMLFYSTLVGQESACFYLLNFFLTNDLIFFHINYNAAQEYNNGQGWSREHVWPQSHGDFGTSRGVGTDAHHLRPCDISVNSARGNDDFYNGGTEYIDGDGPTGCYTTSLTWEPRDAVKGDVARMIFYMVKTN